MNLLSDQELRDALSTRLNGWKLDMKRLQRTFHFPSFRAAMSFVNGVADLAEKMNHHPDIDVRYDIVLVNITSHDAGGITHRDLALAGRIDELEKTSLSSGKFTRA